VYLLCLSLCYIMQGRQLFGESMFLQSLSCFVGRKSSYYFVQLCYRWSLLVWIIGFGPMSLHWLQGMPFWASWLWLWCSVPFGHIWQSPQIVHQECNQTTSSHTPKASICYSITLLIAKAPPWPHLILGPPPWLAMQPRERESQD
jgi:hypothetical protein